MAFTARNRSTIRDRLLADWSARYSSIGVQLLTIPGSDAYMLADALSVQDLLIELQAESQTKAILPDQADTDSLNRHGAVDGVTRRAASPATHKVTITGTASQTITFSTAVLIYNGVSYGNFTNGTSGASIASVTLDGGGNTTVPVNAQALSPGSATTLPDGTILTWSSTPTNASSTATIASSGTVVAGLDAEIDLAYANRIIARRQNRPASGNRADWLSWVGAYSGVVDVYVYPLLKPPGSYPGAGTPNTLGCVTVVPLGATPLDAQPFGEPLTNRVIGGTAGGDLHATIGAYIEGTGGDGSPNAQASGIQLRPVTMALGDYSIEAIQTQAQDVEVECVMSPAYAFPWAAGAYAVLASPAPTTTTFSVSTDITSVVKPGGQILPVLVNVGTDIYRGGYYAVTPTSVTYNGGTGNTDFVVPTLPGAPVVGEFVLPAPPNFAAIRTAIFSLFDVLGPGDTSPASRWPSEDTKGRSTLYLSAITGRLVQELDSFGRVVSGVRGLLSATVAIPFATITPPAKTLLVLRKLKIYE